MSAFQGGEAGANGQVANSQLQAGGVGGAGASQAASTISTSANSVQRRFNIFSQMELIHSKMPGTGSPDTTKWEWMTTAQRDTFASHVGRYSRLGLFATVENESVARVRYNMMQAMIQPCGKPPKGSAGMGG